MLLELSFVITLLISYVHIAHCACRSNFDCSETHLTTVCINNRCVKPRSFRQACESDDECVPSSHLYCSREGRCECPMNLHRWRASVEMCSLYDCESDEECSPSEKCSETLCVLRDSESNHLNPWILIFIGCSIAVVIFFIKQCHPRNNLRNHQAVLAAIAHDRQRAQLVERRRTNGISSELDGSRGHASHPGRDHCTREDLDEASLSRSSSLDFAQPPPAYIEAVSNPILYPKAIQLPVKSTSQD